MAEWCSLCGDPAAAAAPGELEVFPTCAVCRQLYQDAHEAARRASDTMRLLYERTREAALASSGELRKPSEPGWKRVPLGFGTFSTRGPDAIELQVTARHPFAVEHVLVMGPLEAVPELWGDGEPYQLRPYPFQETPTRFYPTKTHAPAREFRLVLRPPAGGTQGAAGAVGFVAPQN